MNYEEKMAALGALTEMPTDVSLFMRSPGDWGCHIKGVERKEGSCLSGGGLSGKTPEGAVNAAWEWATDPRFYMVTNAYRPERKAYRWNGFMWREYAEPAA